MRLTLQRPLAFFDLETTGTRIGRDRIVQIGIVRLHANGERERYQTLVNPGIPIPEEATAVHGITDADVADAPSLEDVHGTFWTNSPAVIWPVSTCCASMCPFLAEELYRAGFDWDHASLRMVDVQRIYHQMEPRNLSAALRFYCAREHAGAHDAMADVEATADVLLAQLDAIPMPCKGPSTSSESSAATASEARMRQAKLMFDDRGNICLAFGKYKGWTLENIGRNDPGYLQWLMTKAELPGSTLGIMRSALADLNS
jgi:DNA polymerase III subunit epsilon